jgi:hypothetical protein
VPDNVRYEEIFQKAGKNGDRGRKMELEAQ